MFAGFACAPPDMFVFCDPCCLRNCLPRNERLRQLRMMDQDRFEVGHYPSRKGRLFEVQLELSKVKYFVKSQNISSAF